ncbi:MAG: monovalent cation/H+ antiporter complex subunit F [Trueperaceae bacterium]
MILFEGSVTFLSVATLATMVAVAVSILVASLRVMRGPSLPDRVVALDLVGLLAVSVISVVAIATEQPVLLDAAIALALIAFLSTVAFARFIEWQGEEAE